MSLKFNIKLKSFDYNRKSTQTLTAAAGCRVPVGYILVKSNVRYPLNTIKYSSLLIRWLTPSESFHIKLVTAAIIHQKPERPTYALTTMICTNFA